MWSAWHITTLSMRRRGPSMLISTLYDLSMALYRQGSENQFDALS